MSLEAYFQKLIEQAESSEEISNAGKDKDGFYKPTKTILLRHLNLLRDLHGKPLAKKMCQASWAYVTEHVPPEWLIAGPEEKQALKKMLE
ncbi:hypothetical protein EZJ49_12550 [Bdellovibrio bacteriovorus]|uniref:hypothetical protein n=1 Tax=Bdellovibrio bacteriovorus TaxID=959 RepID=UPI0021CEB6F3|nr:hypothetical protein [Bdellovibrio bacteriovorus]UXR63894.1 hypothetical protein EZJ49_12550 [Bdellovibrio bacteriovorus]